MKHFFLALLAVAGIGHTAMAQTQTEVNRSMYPDYTDALKPDKSLLMPRTRTAGERPAYVNNHATKYFPPIFNQVGGSCGSASRISYMFAYEINCLNDRDGKLKENQYPSHFTWLLTNGNSGKEGMAMANGVPNAVTYGGFPYSSDFGIQDAADNDFGWMQGYDKWYAAMQNRIERNANFPLSVQTEEGREAVKNWLWNHNGDTDFPAGGICGIGVASRGLKIGDVSREHNSSRWDELPTLNYVKEWGPQVDHALTIVGYDDLIAFDLDGNGVYGEKAKDEVGAWIVANSWGSWWCGTGLIYCPYKNAVPSAGSTGYYTPEIYYARKNYRPLRTLKILMEYSHRSELKLSAGISADTAATEPEQLTEFEHFKYAGNGSGRSPEPAVPMLGRWADGTLHYEPMEFGYDLTDLSAAFDTRRPLKYFFIIESKAGASGNGIVHNLALVDYEFDREGMEIPFPVGEGVSIQNKGKKTIISVVVNGEPINAPRNVTMKEGQLTWEAPAATSYVLKGYNVYSDDVLVQTVGKDVTACTPEGNGALEVAVVYVHGDEEIVSKRVKCNTSAFYGKGTDTNHARNMTQSGFKVKELCKEKYQKATLEFWIFPTALANYNQQIGPGWGSFLFHTNADGAISVGWSTGARINTASKTLAKGKWAHVAITVDGNLMTLYVNGQKKGQVAGSYGIGGFGDLNFGMAGANGIRARLDEVRFWDVARTEREIQAMMYCQAADPQNTPGLLLNLQMNEEKEDAPVDSTGNYVCELFAGTHSRVASNTLLVDKRELAAQMEMPEGPYCAGMPISIRNASSANAIRFDWINSDDENDVLHVEEPTYIFDTPGEKTIVLKAYAVDGSTAEDTVVFNVDAMPVPVASFECPDNVVLGERITFINATTPADGCSYEWIMTGGSPERATTVNAATAYSATGQVTVTLKATNAAGTSTASKTITVDARAPQPAFSLNQTVVLKGASIQLTDESRFSPTGWNWVVKDAMTHNVYNEQNPAFTVNDPGVYTVELTAGNAIGRNTYSKPRAITVCNADGGTGLNFSTNETVSFDNPIDLTKTNSMTIDYWFYPKVLLDTYNHIGGSKASFQIRTHMDGTMSIELGNITFNSMPGLVTPLEWHHYAITFAKELDPMYGVSRVGVKIYKDGKHKTTLSIPVRNWPEMPAQLTIGGQEAPMDAVIDEFRIWNKELSVEEIRAYANAPIDNVAEAEKNSNLTLYYHFNQSGGSVQDAASGANHGLRTGFGPDGDAWTPSFGIFYLNNTKREDVSANYLTNYQTPFLHTGEKVGSADQFMYLLEDETTSTWVAENGIFENNVYTGFCVNVEKEDMLAVATKEYDFASMLTDHKLYQTITLPVGHYVFGAEPVEIYTDVDNYVVVNAGKGLPNSADLPRTAIAQAPLNDLEVAFSLYEETEVSVGLVSNMRGEGEQHIRRFWLERKKSNDTFETGISTPTLANDNVTILPTEGGVVVSTAVPAEVRIANVNGMLVHRSTFCGTRTILLPPGFYIVAGKKFIVR